MNRRQWTVAGMGALALGALSSAQTPSQTEKEQAAPTATAGQRPATLTGAVVPATKLMGADVRAANNEDVGDVKDLVIQPRTGEVAFAIVGFDDLDEAGGAGAETSEDDKTVVLPLSFLSPVVNEEGKLEHVRFTGAIEKVRSAPEFDEGRWSDLSDAELEAWCKTLCEHYGVDRHGKSTAMPSDPTKHDDVPPAGSAKHATALMKCSKLMKTHVHAKADEDLGDVKELGIDTTHGRVLFLVVDMGGFLGIGQKDYALPWNFATLRADEDGDAYLSVPVTKEMLKQAPEYDADEWRQVASPDWVGKLYAYYRVEPYWGKPMEAGYRAKDAESGDKDGDGR
jgi:sporulation protein YlmC with PRC-barrel domain